MPHKAAGIRTDPPVSDPNPRNEHAGGYRGSCASGRTASYLSFVPRVSNGAMAGIIGGYAIRQFMKIGLCTGYSAFFGAISGGAGHFFCGIVERPRSSGGDKHGRVDIVFDY
ncbi:MAG: hypothetical protein CM15mP21_2860 [Hyphomicrobiales bacterium]|nr:MAG: hypothetical protein CM15mP21_2860 [Hyphomicrobiales bacterium]